MMIINKKHSYIFEWISMTIECRYLFCFVPRLGSHLLGLYICVQRRKVEAKSNRNADYFYVCKRRKGYSTW